MDPGQSVHSDFAFCETCFFLNPFDVTEPYWRDWLPEVDDFCDIHGCAFDHLSASAISTTLEPA